MLGLLAGCASTVGAVGDDGGRIDAVASPDAGAVDASAVDRDVDASIDARRCPAVTATDVPRADVSEADGPYVVELAIEGDLHQCARMSDGTVRCRGWNASGQLGLGTVTAREGSSVVPGLSDVAQVITVISDVTCIRHGDGSVRCWGSNANGLLGTGHDGDLAPCDCRPSPTLVPGISEVIHLASDWSFVYAVRRDGSVWRWGSDRSPTGTAVPVRVPELTDVAMLWPLSNGLVARQRSGRYVTLGVFDHVQRAIVDLEIPAEAEIDAADPSRVFHLCFRLPDGSVRCLGENSHGELGDGTTTNRALSEAVDPGLCGVRSVAVHFQSSCALLLDHTVQCWGGGAVRPLAVPGLDGVDRVFVGGPGRSACALRLDRSVWCWGNWSGLGMASDPPAPVAW